jgi:gamma-glutamylcysteine synthetase
MEKDKPVSVSDDSKVAIPLRNLISILGAVAVSTWAYYGVIERLNSLESTVDSHWEEIEENDDWIDEFEPPKAVQDTVERVRQLELRLVKIETIINMEK